MFSVCFEREVVLKTIYFSGREICISIEKVGHWSVQVVMGNVIGYQKKVKKVGHLIEERYLHLILNGCIAHVLDLMWEDIGQMR